jgi:cysteine-rich repeat protein
MPRRLQLTMIPTSVARVAIASSLATACINDPTFTCGELACPTGSVCTSTGCAAPDQLAACAGLADLMMCSTSKFAMGTCVAGVCQPLVCGDGKVVAPEVCDDGNQSSGDGCSADCLSTEVCGNGYTDAVVGEQCDNGLFGLSRDGCTSRCTIEFDTWTNITPTLPDLRFEIQLAYDEHRQRIVMFGGFDSTQIFGSTWEWDGHAWRQFNPVVSPPARGGHMLAYDGVRGRVMLFGGNDRAHDLADTWEWDGITWTQLAPATSPPARSSGVMTYDPVHHDVLLFGGSTFNNSSTFVDTWTWDGTNWSRLSTASSPPGGYQNVMAYNAPSAQLVLFAGTDATTWAWTGTTWTPLSPASSPPTRTGAGLASEPNGHLLLFAGYSGGLLADLWEWANNTWTKLTPNPLPFAREYFGMAFDPDLDQTVVFGGLGVSNDTWQWDGSSWTFQNIAATPGVRDLTATAYIPLTGTTLLYGGVFRSDTWLWDRHAWIDVSTQPGPLVRWGHQMVGVRDQVLLFGGSAYDDTWRWDGTWHQLAPATTPPARQTHMVAYDSGRDRVVMFGGQDPSTNALGDTWEWDGVDWQQRTPAHSPPARMSAMIAFDSRRQRTVLFGGITALTGTFLGDTWEWDGSDWTERTTSAGPKPRDNAGMAYDATRGTTILFGGNAPAGKLNDTWEWDGTDWHKLETIDAPSVREQAWMVYDAAHSELMIYGGDTNTENLAEVWAHTFSSHSVPIDACVDTDTDGDGLIGCADPDCWGRCNPLCPPLQTCDPSTPHCGDGTCSVLEDYRLCPSDCSP